MRSDAKHLLAWIKGRLEVACGLAGKAMLSCALACLFIPLGQAVKLWCYPTPPPVSRSAASKDSGRPNHQEGRARMTGVFWPQFPHSAGDSAHEMTLNGVQFVSQDWETAASASTVIEYYRAQMEARGWQDVTEASYGLSPDAGGNERDATILQSPQRLVKYRRIMESNLMLIRDSQCLQINTVPSENHTGMIDVRICAAATPSIKDFFDALATAGPDEGNGGPTHIPLDTVQHNGGQRYHTTMSDTHEDPSQVFQRTLADLQAQGWRPVMTGPGQHARVDYFACLCKDKRYAMLMVKHTINSQSASVVFTEVAPE